jgi:hypothetical protein
MQRANGAYEAGDLLALLHRPQPARHAAEGQDACAAPCADPRGVRLPHVAR